MDSIEVLNQFFSGIYSSGSAIGELEKTISNNDTSSGLISSAKARYALSFIRRLRQFQCGEASEKDLCLNLRDLLITHGPIKLSNFVYQIAAKNKKEFGFVLGMHQYVSSSVTCPEWIQPRSFVEEVYGLKDDDLECETSSVGDAILSTYTRFFTYKSFEQKVAVHTALKLPDGHTLLISQPTGGGKSLVTQVLAASSEGLTIVIVPTVALALDQYYAAKSNLRSDEKIYCYKGDQSAENRVEILSAIRNKTAKLIFTSPEAILKNTELFSLLETAAIGGYLDNVVVDEAHVVPDWGIFFRPDFQLFSIVAKKWQRLSNNHLRTFLLSATLSDDVVGTLFDLFGSDGKNVQLRCDSLRQEPRFLFYPVKGKQEQDAKTIDAVISLPKPLIVYVLEPREAKDLQHQLIERGFKNIPCFTGETRDQERDKILRGWKENLYDVVIATSAFGIGVDKPDVRSIVHACAPENLSRFYQEVGRGGRDRLPSLSLLIPYTSNKEGEGDLSRAFGLVNKRVLKVSTLVTRWFSMFNHQSAIIDVDKCILDTSVASAAMTGEQAEYAGNRNIAWNVNLLLFLHRTGFVSLEDVVYGADSGAYQVKLKLLKPEILSEKAALTEALAEPRAKEYASQTEGYRAMSKLITSPRARCWGRAFRQLFPLAMEVCNGCPCDPEGRITTDRPFKVRQAPCLTLPPENDSRILQRRMGSFNTLLVLDDDSNFLGTEELETICRKAENCGIGALVIPNEKRTEVQFSGLVLTYEEFYFSASMMPFLFSRGLLCIFPEDDQIGNILYKNLRKLDAFQYATIIYCSEHFRLSATGRSLSETINGYSIRLDQL